MEKIKFIFEEHKYRLLWYYFTIVMAEVALTSTPIITGVLVSGVTEKDTVKIFLFVGLMTLVFLSSLIKRFTYTQTVVQLRKTIHGRAVENAWKNDYDVGVVSARYHQAGNIRVFIMLDIADILRMISSLGVIIITLSYKNIWFGFLSFVIILITGSINLLKAKWFHRYVKKQHDLEEKKLSVLSSRRHYKLYRYIKQQTNIILANMKIDLTGYIISMPLTTIGILLCVLYGAVTDPAVVVIIVGLFYQLDKTMDQFSVVQQSISSFKETVKRF